MTIEYATCYGMTFFIIIITITIIPIAMEEEFKTLPSNIEKGNL